MFRKVGFAPFHSPRASLREPQGSDRGNQDAAFVLAALDVTLRTFSVTAGRFASAVAQNDAPSWEMPSRSIGQSPASGSRAQTVC